MLVLDELRQLNYFCTKLWDGQLLRIRARLYIIFQFCKPGITSRVSFITAPRPPLVAERDDRCLNLTRTRYCLMYLQICVLKMISSSGKCLSASDNRQINFCVCVRQQTDKCLSQLADRYGNVWLHLSTLSWFHLNYFLLPIHVIEERGRPRLQGAHLEYRWAYAQWRLLGAMISRMTFGVSAPREFWGMFFRLLAVKVSLFSCQVIEVLIGPGKGIKSRTIISECGPANFVITSFLSMLQKWVLFVLRVGDW